MTTLAIIGVEHRCSNDFDYAREFLNVLTIGEHRFDLKLLNLLPEQDPKGTCKFLKKCKKF